MASQLVHGLESMVEAGVRGLFGFMDPELPPALAQMPTSTSVSDTSLPAVAHTTNTQTIPAPRATRTSPSSPGSIITTVDVPSGWIHLQSAYLDGQRKTKQFGLKNLVDAELEVEIDSDLGEQLAFWIPDDEQSSSSSSASSRSQISSSTLHLILPPLATVPIGLAFQPSHSVPTSPAFPLSPSIDEGGFTPRVAPTLSRTHSSELNLPLVPHLETASEPSSVSGDSSQSVSGISSLSERVGKKHETVYRAFSVHGSIAIRANATSDVQAPSQRQNLALPFFASVCRSHFTVSLIHPVTGLQSGHQLSKGELHVDFGNDAVVGGEYHRDILLVNRSEIDLVWSTSVVNSKHSRKIWVSLRDLDSENVFGSDGSAKPVPLPALSSRHLRLTLHVTEPVENFRFDFVLSNLHQPTNMVTCRVTGSASALPVDKSLKILSGTSLDFGEICDGVWAKKMITCKNSGDKTLDVSFSSDPGHEVVFRLAGVAGEDMDDEVPQHGQGPRLKEKRSIEQLSRTSTRDGRGRSSRPSSPSSSHGWLPSIGGDSVVTTGHLLSEAGGMLHNSSDVTSSDGRDSTTPSRPPSRATSHASSHRHLTEDLAASDDDDLETPFFNSGDPPLQPASPVKPATVPAPSAPTFMDTVAFSSDLPNQIEELTMRPGTEYRILAMYRSPRDIVSPPDVAGALRKTSFRIYLDFAPASRSSRAGAPARSRQAISCTAESCTSIIQLANGNKINFGEVTVGASKSAVITIANLSALSARVEIAAISKVLSTNRNVIIIPPFETVDEKVEFFPRRINDSYEKQLFVRNLLNRANDQLLEVRSKNVDVYNVTLHSHLYRILTPSGSNYLDFGSVVINCPTVRTIQFENLTPAGLALDLSASAPEDVQLYARVEAIPDVPTAPVATHRYTGIQDGPDRILSPPTGELKERFMETMNEASGKEPVKSNKGKVAKARDKSTPRPTEPATDTATKPSVAASVAAALKKGGRGRPVLLYGNAVVFKDRSLLQSHEYLDLASGPPMAAHRMSPRSKRTQLLDTIELEDKTKLSGQHPKIPKLDFAAGAKASGSRSKDTKLLRKKAVAASPILRADSEKPSAAPTMPPPSIQHLISSLARNSTPALEAGAKSPALTAKRAQPRTEMFDPSDVSKMTIDALLATLEQQDIRNKSTSQDTPEADEQFVRRLIAARKELQNLINVGQLVPITSLTVAPSSTRQVVVVMTPNGSTRPHITTRGKRSDSRLFIKLADFDRRMLCTSAGAKTELDELPVRDLIIRSSCVRSVLEVQQSSINFGVVEKGETRSKTIVVHNRSDCIGVFRMRTSGSIASGNLKLGLGRYGVISAFGRKEVENFTFSPSLVGNFQETIVVENVLDPLNNQNVLIKAAVRKQPSFACDLQHIDFGMLQPSKALPSAQGFVVTNTSKHERVFVVEVETAIAEACAEVSLSKDDKDSGTALSKTEEEELEALLQKLKIARRKGKTDKIAKYESRLTELGVAQPAVIGEESEAEGVASTGEPPSASTAVTPIMPGSPLLDKVRTKSLQITLSPNQKQRVVVELLACQGCLDMLSTVKIYERKNTDEVLTVQISFKASAEAERQSTTSP